MKTQLTLSSIQSLLDGNLSDPSSLLGSHSIDYRGKEATAIRMFSPDAQSMWVIDHASGIKRPMRRVHPEGVFETICDPTPENRYKVEMIDKQGQTIQTQDPYAVTSLLSDLDRYLIGEGRHMNLYHRLGAQIRNVDGVAGVNFAVWAPNARAV